MNQDRYLEDDRRFDPATVAPLTEDERKFLASFKAAWDEDAPRVDRKFAVPVEDEARAEDEYSGLGEDQDFWFDGVDFVHRDEDGEIDVAGCVLPSERFYG